MKIYQFSLFSFSFEQNYTIYFDQPRFRLDCEDPDAQFACVISIFIIYCHAGLGGSVGIASRLETRRSWVQPLPRSATFFRGD